MSNKFIQKKKEKTKIQKKQIHLLFISDFL